MGKKGRVESVCDLVYLVSNDDVFYVRGRHALSDVVVHPRPRRFGTHGEPDDLLVGHTDGQTNAGVVERSDDLFVVVEDFDMLNADALDQLRHFLGTRKVVGDAPVVDT